MEVISTNIEDSGTIELYWQDEVFLDVDLSLVWIKSGQKEIQDYVDDVSKPEITDYITTQTTSIISNIINDDITPLITNTSISANQAVVSANSSANSAELSKQYANDKINQTHITNCITEIPQDIKLELNNGTLILKAGSKLYVPSGRDGDNNLKFAEYIVSTDRVYTSPITMEATLVMFITGNGGFTGVSANVVFSGNTPPVSGVLYKTDDNIISFYSNNSLGWSNGSFPIAVIKTSSGGTIASVKHIFNGFGYIGSTVFALPGVKGLIPNGRNTDGSLNNIEFIINNITLQSMGGSRDVYPVIGDSGIFSGYYAAYVEQKERPQNPANYTIWFNKTDNTLEEYLNNNWNIRKRICPISAHVSNDKIDRFVSKMIFWAADYNDYADIQDYIIERGISGNQWYELYHSKRLRQGGYSQSGNVTFLKPYTNSNYTLINGSNKTTTGFSAGTNSVDWIADGQGV